MGLTFDGETHIVVMNRRYGKTAIRAIVQAVSGDGAVAEVRVSTADAEEMKKLMVKTLNLIRKSYVIIQGRSRITFYLANFSEIVVYLV